jgi:hypothetical protein
MTSLDLRDCECDPETNYMDLQHIVMMYRCTTCRGIISIVVTDIDGAMEALSRFRAVAFYGRVTPEGVQRVERPAD